MNKHRYILEKGSKKHLCINCNRKTFVFYIDTITNEYLPEQYGRCDRESKCSYHLNPYLDGFAKTIHEKERSFPNFPVKQMPQQRILKSPSSHKPVFFDHDIFKQTLEPDRYEKNRFIQNLFYKAQFPFEVDDVTKLIELYRLGTISNGYRCGAITFPFIDIAGNVRAIQVKQFDEANHTIGTDFLHSILEKEYKRNYKPLPEWLEAYINQEKRVSCLFGEHLLSKYPTNPIALVEAPKTAVYGTLYFGLPETSESLIWLAVYNKSSFTFDKLKVLKGRFVYVFPDLSKDGNTFREWEAKANDYENRMPGTRFVFSDLLERLAPERDKDKGNDLADYLVLNDWRLFRKGNIQVKPPPAEVEKVAYPKDILFSQVAPLPEREIFKTEKIESHGKLYSEDWMNEIEQLENDFAKMSLPERPIKLNNCTTIENMWQFLKSHLDTLKANNGKRRFLPFFERLKLLRTILNANIP